MKIEIFVIFEYMNQHLSFHVRNVKFLSQEPLKKKSYDLFAYKQGKFLVQL